MLIVHPNLQDMRPGNLGAAQTIEQNQEFIYQISEGIGAYEVKGEMNGVFIKYLKKRILQPRPLLDMLNKVFLGVY
jgi:hypothetical protein